MMLMIMIMMMMMELGVSRRALDKQMSQMSMFCIYGD